MIMTLTNTFYYFYRYYYNYPISVKENAHMNKYNQIYNDTINQFNNTSIVIFNKFIDVWTLDSYNDTSTNGSSFSICLRIF
jgi:hypothetical protein